MPQKAPLTTPNPKQPTTPRGDRRYSRPILIFTVLMGAGTALRVRPTGTSARQIRMAPRQNSG